MSLTFSKILLPSIVGISVYLIINKLFPEKLESLGKNQNPIGNLRGGDRDRMRLAKKIAETLLKDKALKIAIISVFTTAGVQHFQDKIKALLVDDIFNTLCVKGVDVDDELKIICDIVQEHDLNSHAKSIKLLIISNELSSEQKISLLKIKLDFIINGECMGKRRFLVIAIIAGLLTFTVSGVGGLALIFEAVYKQIVKRLAKKWGVKAVPIEHLLDN